MQSFESELLRRRDMVHAYLTADEYRKSFVPKHINDAVWSYIDIMGKSLRPAALLFCCGAVSGDETIAMPAAAAIEVYHTWTLVHDDIIDRDEIRRGKPTVHTEFAQRGMNEFMYDAPAAQHYGVTIAMLAGDAQQGWSISLMCELYTKRGVDPRVVLWLINHLTMRVQLILVEGETLDVQYARCGADVVSEDLVLGMLWKKTGVLYEFAGSAGAMIGLNSCDPTLVPVRSLSLFAGKCGTAFQLQDDILGVIGDERLTGKPVGSDIREGKKTVIVSHALRNANAAERNTLLTVLGNRRASLEDVRRASRLLQQLDGIEYTKRLARKYVEDALQYLADIPASRYKDLLSQWAEYLITREL